MVTQIQAAKPLHTVYYWEDQPRKGVAMASNHHWAKDRARGGARAQEGGSRVEEAWRDPGEAMGSCGHSQGIHHQKGLLWLRVIESWLILVCGSQGVSDELVNTKSVTLLVTNSVHKG